MKMRKLFGLFILLLCVVLSTGMVFADNVNTDDDEADRDGSHTFTTDGERYGYESYLCTDGIYVGARLYDVTIPEEGKLVAEIDSDQITHMTIEICSKHREEKNFTSDGGVKGSFESEALPAGTYTVIFEYTTPENSIIPYDEGGKRFFKHYITWVKTPVVKAQSLTLSETAATIERGGYLELTASVNPANAYHRTVTWMSSDPSVAKVSDNGYVYGVSEGTAVITATNSDGITKNSCTVTVTKTAAEIQEDKAKNEAKTKAKEVLESVKKVIASYTAPYKAAVEAAIKNVENKLADAKATAAEINGAVKALNDSVAAAENAKAETEAVTKAKAKSEAEAEAKAKASNINKSTVSAVDVKIASALGAKEITLGPKVKKIKSGAFKGTDIKTVIVKSKKLKANSVKGSLKGSKVKTIKVKVGKAKENKKYIKIYKKIFNKKNAGKKVTVKP